MVHWPGLAPIGLASWPLPIGPLVIPLGLGLFGLGPMGHWPFGLVLLASSPSSCGLDPWPLADGPLAPDLLAQGPTPIGPRLMPNGSSSGPAQAPAGLAQAWAWPLPATILDNFFGTSRGLSVSTSILSAQTTPKSLFSEATDVAKV
jgi:hypothetical protein